MIFVTGGAGFMGANFFLDWLAQTDEPVVNFAAESHVDRSIHGPEDFIHPHSQSIARLP